MNKKGKNDVSTAIGLLKEVYDNNYLRLPKNITFKLEDNKKCTIILKEEYVKNKNMQENANAFEGWAVAMHFAMKTSQKYTGDKIILDIDQDFNKGSYKETGHWWRFLYRALHFKQQYDKWFCLSPELGCEVEKFAEYLKNNKFVNNVAKGTAGVKSTHNKESSVEAKLSKKNVLKEIMKKTYDVGDKEVFRQLPVGLFEGEVKKENKVFTGGKSAIDLWTWKGDEDASFEVIELKVSNPMIGIITEIFFYSNYMYDLMVGIDFNFVLNKPIGKKDDRGYHYLKKGHYKQIIGIMLADKYHPLIRKEFIEILNDNQTNDAIKYIKANIN